ncbi:hypothetical protein [Halorubrum tibetense]|uniref:DUF4149 domain-containing protein n=1 Tax=Halorubrum tibetense TaxID=175631 RepID=A0ABD5SDH9_9EURY
MRALVYLVVGIVGLLETLLPGVFVDAFTRAAYRDTAAVKPRSWFRTVVRIEGAILVLFGLIGLFRTARSARATNADAARDDAATPDTASVDAATR